jgi:AraC-like DNA-binding protein
MTKVIQDAVDIVPCGDGMFVGLSHYGHPQETFESDDGADWLKFHFQLRGSARYSVAGYRDCAVEGAASVFSFHGRGLKKSIHLAAQPGFSVTILCNPHSLMSRFGLHRGNLPTAVQNNLDSGDSSWFAEIGRLTPEMTISLRALETMPFNGLMRRAYIEARATEMLCDLWSQVGRSEPCAHASIDARTMVQVERTRTAIDEGFAEPLAMRRLARDVGTNETKLSRAFRTVYGMTIFEYVRSRRMEEAQRLLRAGKLSVTEIAFEVGYEYSCNFSVAYKRHFGVTPKEERAAIRH